MSVLRVFTIAISMLFSLACMETSSRECEMTSDEYDVYIAVLKHLRSQSRTEFDSTAKTQLSHSNRDSIRIDSSSTKSRRMCAEIPSTKGPNTELVIQEFNEKNLIDSNEIAYFEEDAFIIPIEIVASYNDANQSVCQLDSSRFPTSLRVRVFPQSRSDEYRVMEGKFFDKFYADYPNGDGITSLSRVGFTRDRKMALVHHGRSIAGLAGQGHFILLQKSDDVWKVMDKIVSWVS